MTKIEFLERLEAKLRGINVVDRVRSLDYFSEMIDDCIENGMSEDEAVASLGGVDEIAQRITEEAPGSPLRAEKPTVGGVREGSSAPVDSEFSSIRIRVRESDVNILRSEDGESRVNCVDHERVYHRVFTENGVLNIEAVDERRWFERLKTFNKSLKVDIYLPEADFDSLDIESMSGDIEVAGGFSFTSARAKTLSGNIEFFAPIRSELELSSTSGDVHSAGQSELDSLNVRSVSGDVKLRGFVCAILAEAISTSGDLEASDITCENGRFKSVSGDAKLKSIVCAGTLEIESTSGDVRFEGCEGASVALSSISGDIKGSLMSGKHFTAKSLSGSIRLPKNNPEHNGECFAKTVSGSINLSICR
ncbi:MAG: DUF4097 family beta strand repeat protein [Clostridia bacterium]|nr:DUF4097 family beta strand repeat protein [Clostridia bacterium]